MTVSTTILSEHLSAIVINDGIRIVYQAYDKASAQVATAALLASGKRAQFYSVTVGSKRSQATKAWHVSSEAAVARSGAFLAYPAVPAI